MAMVSFLTSTDSVSYTENLMERITDSIVPISDSVATATLMDDFTLALIDELGSSTSYTRQYTTGIISTVSGNSINYRYDKELGLAYYNYRYYHPSDGCWINCDPIAE